MSIEKDRIKQGYTQKDFVKELLGVLLRYKTLFMRVLVLTFVLAALITLCIPNYYRCTVLLAPELSGSHGGGGTLSALASNLGVNVNSGNAGADALTPTLYPDMMNSVAFRTSLFPILVNMEEKGVTMTYYDYLLNEQRYPWWTSMVRSIKKGVRSLFGEDETSGKLDPFRLTEEQYKIVKDMEDKVVCDVDLKTQVITIDVTDQDPLIAAVLADSVQKRLQDFITDYRTRKARIDLEYNRKLHQEAKERYDAARKQYARFADANRNTLFESIRTERMELENEMQLQYRSYSQITTQLQLAEAKVQEETPAFTTLQPATVPVEKAGPRRAIICLGCAFLAFVITTLYILFREDEYLTSVLNGE